MRRPRPFSRNWLVAAMLAAAALGLQIGLVAPARRERDEARLGFARAREERESLRAAAARLERRAAMTARAPEGDAAALRALRVSMLRATEGLPLETVRISTDAGRRGSVAARGRLEAQGRQADLLRAAGRLADPSSGVLLERLQLSRSGEVEGLVVEGFSVRGP